MKPLKRTLTFTDNVPTEEPSDFVKPVIKANETRSFWVLTDAKGNSKGLLHAYRLSCYCKDVIVVVSNKMPEDYINYLKERNYNIIVAGEEVIDYRAALDKLAMYYYVKNVLTDSGGGLISSLIKEGLMD
jgi:2,5-diamino-6-(ribosylamino)-4(3H)-pyrimidinone 5'-phosphate reductase